jgi:hypothetical protein
METFAFWIPIIFLFITALIGTILKRCSCDHCLKKFNGSKVFIPKSCGVLEFGELCVYAQGIEIIFNNVSKKNGKMIRSLIIHPSEVNKVPFIFRAAPDPETMDSVLWEKDLQNILNPSAWSRFSRISLNFYNMLRDAFGQAAKTILGAVSKDTSLGKVKDANKQMTSIGSELTTLVPNAWEPVLEKNRGKKVIIERKNKDEIVRDIGILEDYSSKFLLVRNVTIENQNFEISDNLQVIKSDSKFDVLYARSSSVIRNTIR